MDEQGNSAKYDINQQTQPKETQAIQLHPKIQRKEV